MSEPRGQRSYSGRVERFDDDRGVGIVVTDTGESFDFHCTSVADGSRSIAEGKPVRFGVKAGHNGHLEASDLVPLAVSA